MSKKIRKFLVVVDDTSECHRAISYASRRALQTDGKITLLRVVNTTDFNNVYGVEGIMKQEAEESARAILEIYSEKVNANTGLVPELVVRFGLPTTEIIDFISEDGSISLLVLAAATDSINPGPLVSQFTGSRSSNVPVPITIIPGQITEQAILELTAN
tara:strand:- start:839 stop:1315 length:477 start_codon:yes stop_codon:yes gene_type:complete